jgi:TRAP-type C4-dicarboxylate transport system substrate-binding protein
MTPLEAGVFDLLYTHPAYHSKGLAVATNAMNGDTATMRSSGVFDKLDEFYQKAHNMKLLAIVPVGTAGYHCYLREPLSADGDWKGRKIRGVSTYVGVIEALGGVPVSTSMGEVYSALEKGVIDGACAPAAVLRATKHFEVAKYRTEPTFGSLASIIGMNLDKWNSLSDEQKKLLADVAIATEKDTIRIGDETLDEDNKAMAEAGVEVTEFPQAVTDKVNQVYYDSVWALAEECCGDDGKQLRELAKKAGLSN